MKQAAYNNYVEGKVIIETGAAGGFGLAKVEKLCAMGAKVVMADFNADALKKEAVRLKEAGCDVTPVVTDVSKLDQVCNMVQVCLDTYGRVDVLVNNVGIMPNAPWYDHEQALPAWEKCIDINLKGTMYGVTAVYDQMIKQGQGQVIFISSIYANYPVYGSGVYQATKIGVCYLAQSLLQEGGGKIKTSIVKPTGVASTNLKSGIVDRESVKGIYGRQYQEFLDRSAAQKEGIADPDLDNINSIKNGAIGASEIAEAVIHCINQPMGVNISEITARATNELYSL